MRIYQPNGPAMTALCDQLRMMSTTLQVPEAWPERQLKACGHAGVFDWFIPKEMGGMGWRESEILRGYIAISEACLTTAFVLTQRAAATRRICLSPQEDLRAKWLPLDQSGQIFLSIAVSQITTSGRHFRRPLMMAKPTDNGWVLDGLAPWVTGASFADVLVLGAFLEDGRTIQVLVPTNQSGVSVEHPFSLLALSESHTARVRLNEVLVPHDQVLRSPSTGETGVRVGGLHTSALALGLTARVIQMLEDEVGRRDWLNEPLEQIRVRWNEQLSRLIDLADTGVGDAAQLRSDANTLVCQATQVALLTAKGAGYVSGHPVGRWCQEAQFFLVWSCPEEVSRMTMRQIMDGAGLAD